MDKKFARLVIILVVLAIGYSILSTPGNRFTIDIRELKTLLMYVLLGSGLYALYVTFRQRKPPGV